MEEEKIPDEVQEAINQYIVSMNLAAREELDNLSSADMDLILHFTFSEHSPLQYKKSISNESLEKIPFFRLFRLLLGEIEEAGEMKLTKIGNLPRKLCFDLYGTGIIKEDMIESGIVKFNKEGDSAVLPVLKFVGTLSGITKKRNNKLSLTKTGERLFKSRDQFPLFKKMLEINMFKFNLGYGDGYPQDNGIQGVIGYTIYLLLRYGREKRDIKFYVDKNLEAFPTLPADFVDGWFPPEQDYASCYEYRIFERFLGYYGFVEIEKTPIPGNYRKKMEVTATDLFREIFEIKKENFQFKQPENMA